MSVTDEDKKIMDAQSDETLADWYCELNRWNWIDELPDEDLSHNDKSKKWATGGRRSELMNEIQERVGHRATSWAWNKERMSIEEHNDFFDGTFCGDKEAKKRNDKRTMDKFGLTEADLK